MTGNQFLRVGGTAVGKMKQMQEATEMEKIVRERAQRMGSQAPPYRLLELIGKGSFGRVFKSLRFGENAVVAVKIIDIDSSDYSLRPAEKDQAIKDFITEISILRTLTDTRAKNINTFYDAFSFHSQLWIISEYCPGGSVHTLMKACPKAGLEERYIIAISRELAVALTYIHKAGIIHRDVKAANILITEDGLLQLCDFGVSGILESSAAKRNTVIGTPYWMAPELWSDSKKSYSTEVDCWAFGCTIYEMATGLPPNARIIPDMLHVALQTAPRLEGDNYSPALREFVSFCLQEQPEARPTASNILKHSFLFNTSKRYPTQMLRELIERFAQWEQSGGQRASLFNPYGAAAPMALDPISAAEDDWNFSTTDHFDQSIQYGFDNSMEGLYKTTSHSESGGTRTRSSTIRSSTPYDQAREEQKVLRGGRKIARIFDQSADPYEYSQGNDDGESDLPLRALSDHSANRETIIDLNWAHELDVPSLDMVELPTIKHQKFNMFYNDEDGDGDTTDNYDNQDNYDHLDYEHMNITSKRLTREWKYPESLTLPAQENARRRTQDWTMASAMQESEMLQHRADDPLFPSTSGNLAQNFRPTLKHTVTEPVGNFNDFYHPAPTAPARISLALEPPDRASMIEIDMSYITRPSTAASSASESAATEFTTGDPFELEEAPFDTVKIPQRTSFHAHSQSEPAPADHNSNSVPFPNYHYRGDGSFSSDSEYERVRAPYAPGHNESPRQLGVAEDYWNRDFLPSLHSRLASAQTQQQPLLSVPDELASYEHDDMWNHYEPDMITTPTMNLGTYQQNNLTFDVRPPTTDTIKNSETRFRSHSRGRIPPSLDQSRNNTAFVTPTLVSPQPFPLQAPPSLPPPSSSTTTATTQNNPLASYQSSHANHSHHTSIFSVTSSGSISTGISTSHGFGNGINSSPEQEPFSHTLTAATTLSQMDPFHLGGVNINGSGSGNISFPEPIGPDPAALEEDADTEVVVAELERLMEDFLVGLRVAEGLVKVRGAGVGVGGQRGIGDVNGGVGVEGSR